MLQNPVQDLTVVLPEINLVPIEQHRDPHHVLRLVHFVPLRVLQIGLRGQSQFLIDVAPRKRLNGRTRRRAAIQGEVNPGFRIGQRHLEPGIIGTEGSDEESAEAGSVGPQNAVLDVVQRVIMAADVVRGSGEKDVALEVVGRRATALNEPVDDQRVVDVDEERQAVVDGRSPVQSDILELSGGCLGIKWAN